MSIKDKLRTRFSRSKSVLKKGDDSLLGSGSISDTSLMDDESDLDLYECGRARAGSVASMAITVQTIQEVEEEYILRHTRNNSSASGGGLSCIPEYGLTMDSIPIRESTPDSPLRQASRSATPTATSVPGTSSPTPPTTSAPESSFDTTITVRDDDPSYFSNSPMNLSADDLLPPIPTCPPSTEEELSPMVLPLLALKRPLVTPTNASEDPLVASPHRPSYLGHSTLTTLSESSEVVHTPSSHTMYPSDVFGVHDYADAMASTILDKVSRSGSVAVESEEESRDNWII